ncbi:hypothetical protein P43SY_002383 [Pythium insidiosum]|uniref:N-acetyltransferase domain-containing protein n=1 Tax=Pythium insidiosum TaxID=114742 RepID=A0AAD5QAQ2_PYTIN|nr:hypothetical protein P43SY_002383 [Pythium insidiosum]
MVDLVPFFSGAMIQLTIECVAIGKDCVEPAMELELFQVSASPMVEDAKQCNRKKRCKDAHTSESVRQLYADNGFDDKATGRLEMTRFLDNDRNNPQALEALMGIEIRRFDPANDDLIRVFDLLKSAFGPSPPCFRAWKEHYVLQPRCAHELSFIAWDADSHRRKGLAQLLLRHCFQAGADAGLEKIILGTDSFNTPALVLCRVINFSLLSSRLHASDTIVKGLQTAWQKELREAMATGLSGSTRCGMLKMLRKLRVLLFQTSSSTRADAIAVVLAGALHGLAPLDAFSHRFLTFTLSDLSQFVAVEDIAPLYLQRAVSTFPDADVSTERLTSVTSSVFGALYFSPVGEQTKQRDRDAITLWALRLCRERVTSLLALSQLQRSATNAAPTLVVTDSPQAESDLPSSHDAGVFLLELFVELAKMAPLPMLPRVARELELLVHQTSDSPTMQATVQQRVFSAIATNCEAEKRAWFTAWYLDLASRYAAKPTTHRYMAEHQDANTIAAGTTPPPRSRL